jgi:hypothetical protein
MELLKRNLSSFQSTTIRLVSLCILAWFPTESNNRVIANCLAYEECPLNVYEYRSMITYLQKLSVDFVLSNQSALLFHLATYYLLAVYFVHISHRCGTYGSCLFFVDLEREMSIFNAKINKNRNSVKKRSITFNTD